MKYDPTALVQEETATTTGDAQIKDRPERRLILYTKHKPFFILKRHILNLKHL